LHRISHWSGEAHTASYCSFAYSALGRPVDRQKKKPVNFCSHMSNAG
jgi:hypothetical protein